MAAVNELVVGFVGLVAGRVFFFFFLHFARAAAASS